METARITVGTNGHYKLYDTETVEYAIMYIYIYIFIYFFIYALLTVHLSIILVIN